MRVFQIAAALALGLGLMGCASNGYQGGYDDGARAPGAVAGLPSMPGTSRADSLPGQTALQCVPYARENSAIKIYGDAWTWWDQAAGRYERGRAPASGTVLVLHDYAGPNHGHVAVVRRIVSAREIRIDHANWLNDGSIFLNNPVMDVSPANDWSQVRVFNIKTGAWGGKVYPVKGFIGSGSTLPRAPAQEPPLEDKPLPGEALLARAEAPAAPARPLLTAAAAAPAALGPPPGSPFALTAEDLAIP